MEDSGIGEELLRAAMCDDFSEVKRLFTAELRNYAGSNGKTIMHAACQAGGEGNLEMVQWLKEHGAELETKNEAGRVPVQVACEMGNLEIVQYMHAHGAAINVANTHGINSVHSACKTGNLELVQFLHSQGCPLDAKDSGGGVAVIYAAAGAGAPSADASLHLIKWLAQQGADLNATNNANIKPLTHAQNRQDATELVAWLKENGAN